MKVSKRQGQLVEILRGWTIMQTGNQSHSPAFMLGWFKKLLLSNKYRVISLLKLFIVTAVLHTQPSKNV